MSSINQIIAALQSSPNYSGVVIAPGSIASIQNTATSAISAAYLTTNTAIVVITGTNGLVTGYIVDDSGATPSIGPMQTLILNPGGGARNAIAVLSPTTAVLFHGDSSGNPLCCVLSISGTTITKGTSINPRGTGDTGLTVNIQQNGFAKKINSTTALIGWGINGGTYNGLQSMAIITVSGTTATRANTVYTSLGSPLLTANDCAILSPTQGVIVTGTGSGNNKQAKAFTISGSAITLGTATSITTWNSSATSPISVTAVNSTTAIAVYIHQQTSTINTARAKLNCFTVSGTTVTPGTEVMFTDANIPSGAPGPKSICMTSADRGVATLASGAAVGTYGASFTLAGTVITKGAATALDLGSGGNAPTLAAIDGTKAMLAIGNSSTATNSRALNITLS